MILLTGATLVVEIPVARLMEVFLCYHLLATLIVSLLILSREECDDGLIMLLPFSELPAWNCSFTSEMT